MRRLSTIDLRLLRIFTTVVDCNGFQKAQIALNIAQSTLSSHITSLEAKLGSKLCERGRGGFKLTRAGQETYDAIEALLRSIEGFEARMGRVHGTRSQVLRITTIDTLVTYRDIALDAAIAAFHDDYPDVAIDLEVTGPQSIEQSIAEGRRDVAIGPMAQALPSLEYRSLTTETHSLHCGSSHPWFNRDDSTIAHGDFLAAHFSVRAYRYFDDVYRFGRATANASVSSMEAQEILILTGKYIGFLPDHAAARWVGSGAMRAIKPQQWGLKSHFFIAHEPSGELKTIKQAFVRHVVDRVPMAQSSGLSGPETTLLHKVRTGVAHKN
jgi:LysR family transcriptional regulator, transcriptional activator for bauABCD operon